MGAAFFLSGFSSLVYEVVWMRRLALFFGSDVYSAALTPVILAAFYWRRATASAAVASIFTGTFVTVFWDSAFIHAHLPAIISERDAIFPALFAAVAAMVVVSLFTPKPAPEQLAQFAD